MTARNYDVDYVLEYLEKVDTASGAAMREAVRAAELLEVTDPELRQRLATALLRVAKKYRNLPPLGVFAGALRRYASLAPTKDAVLLLDFFGKEDGLEVRLTALQAMITMHWTSPIELNAPLFARMLELFEAYIHPDVAISSELRALTANAAVALSVSNPAIAPAVATQIKKLGRIGVTGLVRSKWQDLEKVWPEQYAAHLKEALSVLADEQREQSSNIGKLGPSK